MFMRNNRAKNGAPQPEKGAARDAGEQRGQRRLSTQPPVDGNPDDLRFQPAMSTCEAINNDHYEAGVSGMGPYGTSYEAHIPHVGKGGGPAVADESGDRKLRNP